MSASGSKPPPSVEMATLGKKSVGEGPASGGGSGKSTTSFSATSMRLDSKSLQINQNRDGHKSSLRSTANTMKLKTGNDQLSFDFSKGALSIKTGDTHFTLGRGKDGLSMAATDLKSGTEQGFGVSGGDVTKTLQVPGQKSQTSHSHDPYLGSLAAKAGDRMGQMKSPFQALKSFGALDGKGPDHKLGFSAFSRETRDAGGAVTKSERGFRDLSSEGSKKKTRTEPALGTGADEEMTTLQQRRSSRHGPTHRGRRP